MHTWILLIDIGLLLAAMRRTHLHSPPSLLLLFFLHRNLHAGLCGVRWSLPPRSHTMVGSIGRLHWALERHTTKYPSGNACAFGNLGDRIDAITRALFQYFARCILIFLFSNWGCFVDSSDKSVVTEAFCAALDTPTGYYVYYWSYCELLGVSKEWCGGTLA